LRHAREKDCFVTCASGPSIASLHHSAPHTHAQPIYCDYSEAILYIPQVEIACLRVFSMHGLLHKENHIQFHLLSSPSKSSSAFLNHALHTCFGMGPKYPQNNARPIYCDYTEASFHDSQKDRICCRQVTSLHDHLCTMNHHQFRLFDNTSNGFPVTCFFRKFFVSSYCWGLSGDISAGVPCPRRSSRP
jgi:hypothetical protein